MKMELIVHVACCEGLDMFSSIRCGVDKMGTPSNSPRPVSPAASPMAHDQQSKSKVARKVTTQEGLYKGLGNVSISSATRAHIEAQRMMMLVEAPAAVDDALALVLCSSDWEQPGRRVPGYGLQVSN